MAGKQGREPHELKKIVYEVNGSGVVEVEVEASRSYVAKRKFTSLATASLGTLYIALASSEDRKTNRRREQPEQAAKLR